MPGAFCSCWWMLRQCFPWIIFESEQQISRRRKCLHQQTVIIGLILKYKGFSTNVFYTCSLSCLGPGLNSQKVMAVFKRLSSVSHLRRFVWPPDGLLMATGLEHRVKTRYVLLEFAEWAFGPQHCCFSGARFIFALCENSTRALMIQVRAVKIHGQDSIASWDIQKTLTAQINPFFSAIISVMVKALWGLGVHSVLRAAECGIQI